MEDLPFSFGRKKPGLSTAETGCPMAESPEDFLP
jgi:hypothetical protein